MSSGPEACPYCAETLDGTPRGLVERFLRGCDMGPVYTIACARCGNGIGPRTTTCKCGP